MPDLNVPLSLGTVCGGKLEEEFQRMYPDLLSDLEQGKKASITINLEFARIPNTDTMINVGYKIAAKSPQKSASSVCQLTEGFKLKTEEPPKPKVVQMRIEEGEK